MDETLEEYAPSWYPYEGGATIREIGPAQGYVTRDEELGDPDDDEDADARVTLEQGRADNPGWLVTATLYGWIFQTQRAADEADAATKFDAAKADMERLSALIPFEDDHDVPIKVAKLIEAVAEFEARFV